MAVDVIARGMATASSITPSTDLSVKTLITSGNVTINGDETNINGKLFVKQGAVEMTGGTVTIGSADIGYTQVETLVYRENGTTEPAVYTNVKTAIDGKQVDLTSVTGYSSTGTLVLKCINGVIQWASE